jgi:hypothetical protein
MGIKERPKGEGGGKRSRSDEHLDLLSKLKEKIN